MFNLKNLFLLYFMYIKHYCIHNYNKKNYNKIIRILTYLVTIPYIIKIIFQEYINNNFKLTQEFILNYIFLSSILGGFIINFITLNKTSFIVAQYLIFVLFLIQSTLHMILYNKLKMTNIFEIIFIIIILYFVYDYYIFNKKKKEIKG